MVALDTNIVVRLITEDDPSAVRRARAMILERSAFVQATVLLETEWVLRSVYRFDRWAIDEAFRVLRETESIELEDAHHLDGVLQAYCEGLDFGDAMHVARCPLATFATFDRDLVVRAPVLFPEVEVIAP